MRFRLKRLRIKHRVHPGLSHGLSSLYGQLITWVRAGDIRRLELLHYLLSFSPSISYRALRKCYAAMAGLPGDDDRRL